MVNPFVQENRDSNVLPISPIAMLVVAIVGLIDVISLVFLGILLYQDKSVGQLDTIVIGATPALLALLARTAATQSINPVQQPENSQPQPNSPTAVPSFDAAAVAEFLDRGGRV